MANDIAIPTESITMRMADFRARRAQMVNYLKLKTDEEDWHGVADAAMDLRELDAKIQFGTRLLKG